jgi:hypothetical protein
MKKSHRIAAAVAIVCVGLVVTVWGSGGSQVTAVFPLALSEPANLQHETAVRGQFITITLHSTYWSYLAPSSNIVAMKGSVLHRPAPFKGSGSCLPGMGCGTVVVTYVAQHAGSVTLSAARTTCGEALVCTGTRGRWSTTILIR